MRVASIVVASAVILSLGMRVSRALDPQVGGGVGGTSGPVHVTAGWGRASDDGLAHPGFASKIGAGMLGVTPAGVTGGFNRASDDGFHSSGLGRVITAGVGRSTMETVPGRTPTYINITVGKSGGPMVGGRGP